MKTLTRLNLDAIEIQMDHLSIKTHQQSTKKSLESVNVQKNFEKLFSSLNSH